jgi:hypothetical protein
MRGRIDHLLGPVAASIHHLRVPETHNDLDDWRQADPDRFPYAVLELLNDYDASVIAA